MGLFAVEYMASLQKKAYEEFGLDPLSRLPFDDFRHSILDQLKSLDDDQFDEMFELVAGSLGGVEIDDSASRKVKVDAVKKALWRRSLAHVHDSTYRSLKASGWTGAEMEAQIAQYDTLPDTATVYEDPFDINLVAQASSGIRKTIRETAQYQDVVDRCGNIFFGTMPTGSVNARVLKTPLADDYLALFNNGLFRFTYLIGKVIGQALDYSATQDSFEIPKTDVAEIVAGRPELGRRFRHLLGAYVIAGHPGLSPPYATSPGPSYVASRVAKCMITFLVGHEYGHVIHGDLGSAKPAKSKLLGSNVDEISFSHQSEFTADCVALDLMARTKSAEREVPVLIEWAPILLFLGLHFVRNGFEVLQTGAEQPDPETASHPTVPARLHQVVAPLFESNEPSLAPRRRRTEWLMGILSELWREVKPSFEEGHRLLVSPAKIWLAEEQARSRKDAKIAIFRDAQRVEAIPFDALESADQAMAVGDYIWRMGIRRAAVVLWTRARDLGHAEAQRRLDVSAYFDPQNERFDGSLEDEYVFS